MASRPYSPSYHRHLSSAAERAGGMTSMAIRDSSPLPVQAMFSAAASFTAVQPPATPLQQRVQRPKLSLHTGACPRTLGRGNTGLRLDTLSAVSPTLRNTHKNAYDAPTVPPTPFTLEDGASSATLTSTNTSSSPSSLPSLSTTSTTSSTAPLSPNVPYECSPVLRSALKNTPLLGRPATGLHVLLSASGVAATPSKARRLQFREPLTEVIHTTRYTVAHVDLLAASSAASSPPTGSKRESPDPDAGPEQDGEGAALRDRAGANSTDGDGDGDVDDKGYPKTPVAGRWKRRREWTWTLGPVAGQMGKELVEAAGEVAVACGSPVAVGDLD